MIKLMFIATLLCLITGYGYGQATTKLNGYQQSIQTLQQAMDQVIVQTSGLKRELQEVRQELSNERESLQQEIAAREALQQQLIQETSAREALQEQLSNEMSLRQALQDDLQATKQQLTALSTSCNETVKPVSPVAFAARYPQSTDAGFAGRLIFNYVITNLGNNYDTSRGVFTCPVTGLYLFSYNVLSVNQRSGQSDISANLRVDSVNRWSAYSYNYGSDSMGMNTGGTVILQCSAGSQVEVYKFGSGDDWGGSYTWFTGFLIQPI